MSVNFSICPFCGTKCDIDLGDDGPLINANHDGRKGGSMVNMCGKMFLRGMRFFGCTLSSNHEGECGLKSESGESHRNTPERCHLPTYKGGSMGVTRLSEAIQMALDLNVNAEVSGVVNSFSSDKRTSLAAYLKYSFGPLCRGMEDGDWLREADTILTIV